VWLLPATPAVFCQGDWPQWRGPFLNGSAVEQPQGLPVTWDENTNVRWSLDLPGPGAATPIVWGRRVFVSSVDREAGQLPALCFDTRTGDLLWKRVVSGDRQIPRNTMASPSPVTDGRIVCFAYGTGELFAFDLEGVPVWQTDLQARYGPNTLMFGYSSSPLLVGDDLYVIAIRNPDPNSYGRDTGHEGGTPSYLACLDFRTGAERWHVNRPALAVGESTEAYTTPIPRRSPAGLEILVLGADCLTSHRATDGEELWRWDGFNPERINHWRVVPSPLVLENTVLVAGPKHSTLFAIAPPAAPGREPSVAWTREGLVPDASTPLLYQGRLYVLEDDRRVLTCLDPADGREFWRGELEGRAVIRASMTGVGGRIYVVNEAGEVMVVTAGDRFEVLHRMRMGRGPSQATVAVGDGALFVRTADRLWCLSVEPVQE
jgi:outer membrane protein assembly factor BamB